MGNTDKFEMIAHTYDTPERLQVARAAADAIGEYLDNTKGKKAIDFGCGTGLVGLNLLEDFQSMLFLDTSQSMIDQIKEKINLHHIPNAETLCFDFEKDNLSDLRADCIFMSQVLLHIEDFKTVLKKLYDVLNTGGHLMIIDFNKNKEITSDLNKNDSVVSSMVHNGFDQEDLAGVMAELKYKNIRSKTFYQGNKIFMGHDASMFILDAQK